MGLNADGFDRMGSQRCVNLFGVGVAEQGDRIRHGWGIPEAVDDGGAATNAKRGPGFGQNVIPADDGHQQQHIGHRMRYGVALRPIMRKA